MKNSVRYSKVQCTSGKAGQGGKLKGKNKVRRVQCGT